MRIGGVVSVGVGPANDGRVVLQLLDRPYAPPPPPMARRLGRPVPTQPQVLGTLTVALEVTEDGTEPTGRIRSVGLDWVVPVEETQLREVPWHRLLTAATASYRARNTNSLDAWAEAGRAQVALQPGAQPPARKKGRPALSPAHYQQIADRYRALLAAGVRNPTEQLAQEYTVSRAAAASWVRRARQQGFLNPAVPGRAG